MAPRGQRSAAQAAQLLIGMHQLMSPSPSRLYFLGETPSGVRGISQDMWNIFLNFTQAIGPDLSNYSEDEAWPSLFDTFVEWEMECRKKEEEGLALRANEEEEGQKCTETESSPGTDRLEI